MIGDVNASGDTDGGAWSGRRHSGWTRDIPCQRPWVDIPPDPDELAEWSAANARARANYYADTDTFAREEARRASWRAAQARVKEARP